MNVKSAKRTLKVAGLVAGLVAVLLPTGCTAANGGGGGCHGGGAQPARGAAHTVVAPPTAD
jgi:hypothetical protein